MDYASARSDSKSLFLIHYRLLLQLIVLLILFPSTMAIIPDGLCPRSSSGGIAVDEFKSAFGDYDNDHHDHEATGNKFHPVSDQHCYCPSEQLKENLAPVIRHRLRDLLNKALTVEYVTEAAHMIDLLKILSASNSKLDRIRDDMYGAAQTLKSALTEIPSTCSQLLQKNLPPSLRAINY